MPLPQCLVAEPRRSTQDSIYSCATHRAHGMNGGLPPFTWEEPKPIGESPLSALSGVPCAQDTSSEKVRTFTITDPVFECDSWNCNHAEASFAERQAGSRIYCVHSQSGVKPTNTQEGGDIP